MLRLPTSRSLRQKRTIDLVTNTNLFPKVTLLLPTPTKQCFSPQLGKSLNGRQSVLDHPGLGVLGF